jgi:hypothetical protein
MAQSATCSSRLKRLHTAEININDRPNAQVSMSREIVAPLAHIPVANKNCVWFDVISDRNGKLKVKSDVLEPGVP